MKNRIKKLIAMGILLIPLLGNEILVYAKDAPETELVEPTKPEPISGKKTNAKIKKYNEEVTKYNAEVDKYNAKVDELYEKEKAEVASYNESVDSHNAAEDAKVAEVATRNAEKQAEYDALYEQYQKDLAIEERIKAAGYESTEQYNNTVAPYNADAETAAERNANAGSFDIDSAYTIKRGDPPASDDSSSESTEDEDDDEEHYDVDVYLTYNFDDFSYSTTFTIGQYDTITFYAAGAQLDPEEPGSSILYMTTDDDHLKGSWYPGGSELQSNSVINEEGWNCGDSHTVSYKEGKNHYGDDPTLYMTYNYYWVPKPTYKTYNVPVKPTLDLEEYTPDYWEKKSDPVKKDYLEHLELMDLIKEKKEDEPDEQPHEEQHEEEIIPDAPVPQAAVPAQTPAPALQQILQARHGSTGDVNLASKIYIIIGALAIIFLLLVANFYKGNDSEDS